MPTTDIEKREKNFRGVACILAEEKSERGL